MTLSNWIEKYCEDNNIELPSGISDEKTALEFLILNSSGGGGGGGDFSTAKLTIVRNIAGFVVYVPNLSQEDDDIWYDSIVVDSGEYSSVLYKGYATAFVVDRAGTGREPTITVSGNAEIDDKTVYITGDCTITIS